MPIYALVCPRGHKFEVVAPMKEAPRTADCKCGAKAHRDYAAEGVKGAIIDGEHSGYYHPDTGFPVDPKNPMKRIAPAKNKAKDAFSRLHDESRGAVSYE